MAPPDSIAVRIMHNHMLFASDKGSIRFKFKPAIEIDDRMY